jgi:hypothetical protein
MAGTMSTSRSDPGGGVLGFGIVLLTVIFSAMGLAIPLHAYLFLIVVGTVLAVRSAGLTGFGLGALVLAALMVAMPLVSRLVFAAGASPDLEEPIPVPSGYGLVLEAESTNATHVYASKTLLGHKKAAAKAEAAVLDYYVTRLQGLGWTVVSLGDGAELKAPDSDVGIRVYTYLGVPEWGAGRGTLELVLSAKRCPDENHCEPAGISDVEPYRG